MSPRQSSTPAILFDLDGTLVDTVYEHVLAWSAALRRGNIHVPRWKIQRRVGMSGKSMLRQLFREEGIRRGARDLEMLEARHDAEFRRATRTVQVLPGARELLKFLRQNEVPWAIATTGNAKQTKRLLRSLQIPNQTTVVTGDDVEQAKPSPDVFMLAAERLGHLIENCIVVGDSIWDMLAAGRKRALGVGLLTGGYSKAELEESGAFRVYADPADLQAHVEDLGLEQ
jgi:HAD superfamily hydrolase (TIGR01549 family)